MSAKHMSAKSKRPFYVFAVVAAICALVLVTGIRTSKAGPPSGEPTVSAGSTMFDSAGRPIGPLAEAMDARLHEAMLGSTAGDGSGSPSPDGLGNLNSPSNPDQRDDRPDPESGDPSDPPLPGLPGTPETDDPAEDGDDPPIEARGPQEDDDATDNGDESEGESETATPEEDPDPDEEEPVGPPRDRGPLRRG